MLLTDELQVSFDLSEYNGCFLVLVAFRVHSWLKHDSASNKDWKYFFLLFKFQMKLNIWEVYTQNRMVDV